MDASVTQIQRYRAALSGRRHEHGDVWSFSFIPEEPVVFRAGQYVHVKLEDSTLEKSVRHLSFASAPQDPELLFTVHIRAESPFKQRFLRLEAGETITLFKVKGEFVLPDGAERPLVLLSAGIGITPFRAMLRQLQHEGRGLDLTLLHVDRGPWLYEGELAALPVAQQRCGRSELNVQLSVVAAAKPDALYYIAGPTPFVFQQRDKLLELGIAGDAVRLDDFESYAELWPGAESD